MVAQGSQLRVIVFRRGRYVRDLLVLSFGDAGLGNATRGRSQFGLVIALVSDLLRYLQGQYQYGCLVFWNSSIVKR